MRRLILTLTVLAFAATAAPAAPRHAPATADFTREVMDTERAFAQTMADRDHAAFSRFVSREAVFFGAAAPLRGRDAVTARWKKFFDGPAAPFAWEPDHVEVLDSGTLALSTGPVTDPSGKVIARFNSIWRQEAPHTWRIIFDKGEDICEDAKAK